MNELQSSELADRIEHAYRLDFLWKDFDGKTKMTIASTAERALIVSALRSREGQRR